MMSSDMSSVPDLKIISGTATDRFSVTEHNHPVTMSRPTHEISKGSFVSIDHVNMHTKFEFVAVPIPEIIAIGILGGSCEPPILGNRRP